MVRLMIEEKRAISALSLLIIAIFFLTPAHAKPSYFEEDKSGDDLAELEAMLSGEHRGASYTSSRDDLYSAPQTQPRPGSFYKPPYQEMFLNDTFFGGFIKQLWGDTTSEESPTWYQIFLNGSLYVAGSIEEPDGSRRRIKPILIEEPEF